MFKDLEPALVGVVVVGGQIGAGLDGLDAFEAGKGFGGGFVDAGADACAAGGTLRAVGVEKFDGSAGDGGKGLGEDGAEEHVGVAGAGRAHFDAHVAHNLQTVAEGKDNSLLSRAE